MYNITDILNSFRNTMLQTGIINDNEIIPDGVLHRFHINGDKRASKNGWYVLYLDGFPSGVFGNWKSSISSKWHMKPLSHFTQKEWIEYRRRIEEIRYQHNQIKMQEQQQAARRANLIWNNSKSANPEYPYLLKKHIPPFIARQYKSFLILPITDFDGKIWSLQFIHSDGSKKLLSKGAKKGRFISINGISNPVQLLICEGFATGATLAQLHSTACVIAAIDAGNLETVAVAARNRWPKSKIIICADDDRLIPGNPGQTKASGN